jgi:hypothetical protein
MFVKKHGKITNNYNTTHGIYLKFNPKSAAYGRRRLYRPTPSGECSDDFAP